MGNSPARESSVEICDMYDQSTINRGTQNRPKPLLKFHSVHGDNVILSKDSLIAKRNDSFCKALAFSNRPISINEIVCLRLCEVGTNWSGVLRFGVTNTDPASFCDIELPKFVCPDLTSKTGYWAKALAERYSIDKGILHFFINSSGELYYGINGVNKGLFLNGINVSLPLWIIIDIYGNSIGVEFVDPVDVNFLNVFRNKINSSNRSASDKNRDCLISGNPINTDFNLLKLNVPQYRPPFTRVSSSQTSRMRFHTVKGVNITLENEELIATRKQGEYFLGYVFTERPIQIDEKLNIIVLETEEAFSGSLSFGLTSCDPIFVPASRLPVDNDELLERPEYWVCIKDVGAQPVTGDKLSFCVDSSGKVFFAKNNATPRVIMHVDVSVRLWGFFDLYGTTVKIQLLNSSKSFDIQNKRIFSENSSQVKLPILPNNEKCDKWITSTGLNLDQLKVALPNYDDNLPSTSTRSPSFSIPSGSTLDIRLENVSSSSSSNSISSTGIDPLGLSYNRKVLISKLRNIDSELNVNGSTSSSPIVNIDFDALALSFSSLLTKRRNEVLSNSSSPHIHKNLNSNAALNNYPTYHSLNSTEQGFESARNTETSTRKSILKKATNNEDYENNSTNNECSICMNNKINSVVYRCGHMCMCFECAKETQRQSGNCPICRTQIIDVIRCYPS